MKELLEYAKYTTIGGVLKDMRTATVSFACAVEKNTKQQNPKHLKMHIHH